MFKTDLPGVHGGIWFCLFAAMQSQADSHGIHLPLYAAQKSVVEARLWRRLGLLTGAVCFLAAGALGFWFWYAWFGSIPKTIFAVSLRETGLFRPIGTLGPDQIVFLPVAPWRAMTCEKTSKSGARNLIEKKRHRASGGGRNQADQGLD
jgi:hypothetical protein